MPQSNKVLRFASSQGIKEYFVCMYFKAVRWLGYYSDTDAADIYNHR